MASKSFNKLLNAVNIYVREVAEKSLKFYDINEATMRMLLHKVSDLYCSGLLINEEKFFQIIQESGIKTAISKLEMLSYRNSDLKQKIEDQDYKSEQIKIVEYKGDYIKSCPCSPGCLSCNYFILVPGIGCPFDCSYCFLKFYNKNDFIAVYNDYDRIMKKLGSFMKKANGRQVRIGTGEFTDSLAIDELVPLNKLLLNFLEKYPNLIIEFKTKSNKIDLFVNRDFAPKNAVLAWSLNPQEIIDMEEHGACSLEERLVAMEAIVEKGYSLALHLDPIFMKKELYQSYLKLIEKVFSRIDIKKVKWLSMGGFRFNEALKISILERNNGKKWYLGTDFERSNDGKYRYPDKIRKFFYEGIANKIKEYGNTKIYMCMEDELMWEEVEWGTTRVLGLLNEKL